MIDKTHYDYLKGLSYYEVSSSYNRRTYKSDNGKSGFPLQIEAWETTNFNKIADGAPAIPEGAVCIK
ncbi:MAG: hypothetical protein NC402_04395 [Prevotella sp.]|nr:hypothetical protein [Prevotella sp.]MCM1074157.1 hypothetical protein [Ruminococcus sp.]